MSEHKTALSREWFVAAAGHYHQQKKLEPYNIDYQIEDVVAKHRIFCTDLASLFSNLETLPKERIQQEAEQYQAYLDTWYERLDPVFKEERYQVMSFEGRQRKPSDLFDPYRPGGLWQGPLYSFNFVQIDWFSMAMMFKYKMAMVQKRPIPAELQNLALEACRLFEAIEQWPDSPESSILRTQGCLGMASLFLPKDDGYTMWCRRKLAKIETLG